MFDKKELGDVKSICIVRSSSKLFPMVVSELKQLYPEAGVSAIVTNGIDKASVPEDVERIYATKKSGGFKWGDIGYIKKSLKGSNIDLAVVLYNTIKGERYLNADMFAAATGAERLISVNINKETAVLSKSDIRKKSLRRVMNFFWAALNLPVSLFVLCSIIIVMVVTAPFIFIKKLIPVGK